MEGLCYKSLVDLKGAVSAAYQESLKIAKRNCGRGSFYSRGKFFRALNEKGDLVLGEGYDRIWGGSLKEILEAVADAEKRGAVLVALEGGVDFALNPRDYAECGADPWVAEWAVNVWKKPGSELAADMPDVVAV